MAIVRSIAIGRARGSAGDITYAESKGRTVVRERRREGAPLSSPAQLSHQERRNNLIYAWNYRFRNTAYLWTNLEPYMSPYTMFLKMNAPFSAQPWIIGSSWNITPAGAYVSSGVYNEQSLYIRKLTLLGYGVYFVNPDIIRDIRVGDRIFVFKRASESSGLLLQDNIFINQSHINSINNNGYIIIDSDKNFDLWAVCFYSVFFNRSSIGRFKIVPAE